MTEPIADEEPRIVAMEVREAMIDEDEDPTMEDDEGIPVNDEGTGAAEDGPIADDEPLIVDRDVTEPSPEEEPMADEGFAVEEGLAIDVDDTSIDEEIAEEIDTADVTDEIMVPVLELELTTVDCPALLDEALPPLRPDVVWSSDQINVPPKQVVAANCDFAAQVSDWSNVMSEP